MFFVMIVSVTFLQPYRFEVSEILRILTALNVIPHPLEVLDEISRHHITLNHPFLQPRLFKVVSEI